MFRIVRKFVKNESGATAIEYGLIAALVSVAAIGALTSVGGSLTKIFGVVSTNLDTAATKAQSAGGTSAPAP
ncbi:MAG TPA: Flp family type IVb pilin [Thermomicrobiales bacterium]|nr:Flp family type IVb pilin [Thermomicrobiales bacterium]